MDKTTFVIIDQGVWQERPRMDAHALSRAVREVPRWIAARPREGGGGGTHAVDRTSAGAIRRAITRHGEISRARVVIADSAFEDRMANAEYISDNTPASRERKRRELSDRACRRVRDIVRSAHRCPLSQLDGLYDIMVLQGEVLSRLAALGIGAHTSAMASACKTAAAICYDRLVNET